MNELFIYSILLIMVFSFFLNNNKIQYISFTLDCFENYKSREKICCLFYEINRDMKEKELFERIYLSNVMSNSSALMSLTVEQWELARRLRMSGLSKEQVNNFLNFYKLGLK